LRIDIAIYHNWMDWILFAMLAKEIEVMLDAVYVGMKD
jgi:hypothetical protein